MPRASRAVLDGLDDPQRREAAPAPDQFHFAFEDETLWRRSPDGARAALLQVQEYDVELTSPSGRWDLLSGDAHEADYIYRRLILLDRETGQFYPIPSEAGAWPPPLTAARVSPLPRILTPIEQTVQIWGEVDVRWLGASADTELLVIGEQVVRPGQLRFSVDGEIAR